MTYPTGTFDSVTQVNNLSFDGGSTVLDTSGQLWAGNTGTNPVVIAAPPSDGYVLTASSLSSGGMAWEEGGADITLTGDTGTPITASAITLYANQAGLNCGATVQFSNDGVQYSTLNVTDTNGNTLIGQNAGGASYVSSANNTAVGQYALGALSTDQYNVAVGYAAGFTGSGTSYNTSIGCYSMEENVSGSYNSTCGSFTMEYLQTGSYNTTLGALSGSNYSAAETSNILINNAGISGENNTLHIGAGTGAGNQELSQTFISGITGNPITGSVVTLNTATDQLGVAGGIITAPTDTHTATTAFGTTLSAGTPIQNTLGYDVLVNICATVTISMSASINLGVGPTSSPTTDTVIPSFNAIGIYTFCAVVPNNYYLLVNTSGTITATFNTQVCPL